MLLDDLNRDVTGIIGCFGEWGCIVGLQNRSGLYGVIGEFVEKGQVSSFKSCGGYEEPPMLGVRLGCYGVFP